MSRTSALWAAAAMALVLALLVGAVLLRPLYTSGSEIPSAAAAGQPALIVQQPDSMLSAGAQARGDDDEHDDDRSGEDHEDHDDHEGYDDDD